MELKFIGRGSAFNIKEGNTSAYYKKDNILLLIDCGTTVFKSILDRHLLDNVKEVNVLITHLHDDHVGSLSSLIMYCYYCKGIKVNVYYPNYDIIKYLELTGAKVNVLWNFIKLDYMSKVMGFNKIINFQVKHCEELISYSYLFEYDNKLTYYSGDTTGNLLNSLVINEMDKIYHDTCLADYDGNVHTSLRKLCESIPKEFRHKVYCMHIDNNELIEKAKAEGFNVVEVE